MQPSTGLRTLPALQTAAATRQNARIPVALSMKFPGRFERPTRRGRHDPLFVSQYTHSITLTMTGPTTLNQTFTVTPGSGACPAPAKGKPLVCTWPFALAPGSYRAGVTARDASNAILSLTKGVPAVVKTGAANTLAFTMYGVPNGLIVLMTGNALYGNVIDLGTPRSFDVYPYIDEGGHIEVITGDGTPILTVTQTAGSLHPVIAQPTGTPPKFTISAPSGAPNLGTATLVVTASLPTADGDLCKMPGAVCTSQSFTFNERELVGVCCTNGVQLYGIDGTGPLATIGSASNVAAFTFDAQGDLFVAEKNAVLEYPPPYATPSATISNGIDGAVAIAASNDGKIFVANADANPQSITVYQPPLAAATPAATIVDAVALPTPPVNAPSLNVVNASYDPDAVILGTAAGLSTYLAPYTGAPLATTGASLDLAFGPSGTPYAITPTGFAYCAVNSTCFSNVGSVSGGYAIAVTSAVDVAQASFFYVASTDGNIYAFSQASPSTPLTIPAGFSGQPQRMPANIATDPAGNLAAIDYNGNAVVIHTNPSGKPGVPPSFGGSLTLTHGIASPQQVEIFP